MLDKLGPLLGAAASCSKSSHSTRTASRPRPRLCCTRMFYVVFRRTQVRLPTRKLRLKTAYRDTASQLGLQNDEVSIQVTCLPGLLFSRGCCQVWRPAFPDSADVLKPLDDLGSQLVILGNINNASFSQ